MTVSACLAMSFLAQYVRPTMKAKNLADLYGSPLLEWDRIEDRLAEGVPQAPGDGGPQQTHMLVGDHQRRRKSG